MTTQRMKNPRLHCWLHLGLAIVWPFVSPVSASDQKAGKHLFILSGQSNMTGTVRDAFAAGVRKRFGEENAVVVMRMKSGRGIRFWVADYHQPTGRGLTDKKMNSNGQEYKPLIEAVMAATKDKSFDTVGFIWMQGESDANNRLSEVYQDSFIKLIEQLERDLGRDDLYFVIGRINDYARSRPDNEHWHRVRKSQVRLGNSKGNAWIDTDDLNGGNADQPHGDIHFPREGAASLGKRFADKAMELIDKSIETGNHARPSPLDMQ
ncbi:sialate O-acetylesterase [Pirellulaceae bacterium]|nr:sialate O-acetylesterase [Pirellulaceae bacterium]